MRIEELLAESQQLDELGLKDVGQGLKQAAGAIGRGVKAGAGAVGKAAGAVVGAIPGVAQTAGDAVGSAIGGVAGGLRRGFNQASIGQRSNFGAISQRQQQNNLDKQQQDPNATVGATAGQQNTTQGSAATNTQGTTQATATTNAAQAATPAGNTAQQANPQATAQAAQQAKVGVGQINKIIPGLSARDLQSIKTNIDKVIATKAKQPAATTQPAQPQPQPQPQPQGNQTVTKANTVVTPQANQQPQSSMGKYSGQPSNVTTGNIAAMAESVEFYSNFLGKNI